MVVGTSKNRPCSQCRTDLDESADTFVNRSFWWLLLLCVVVGSNVLKYIRSNYLATKGAKCVATLTGRSIHYMYTR